MPLLGKGLFWGRYVNINCCYDIWGLTPAQHCKIGPFCKIAENEVVPDYTVVYGDGARREDRGEIDELKIRMVERQVDVLRKLIPSNLGKWS